MNCDTRLAINLRLFNLGENDEFIFAIKNYSYIDSPCVFLFRARATDIDDNGEVIFKIAPEDSKKIKPGAIYNFSMLIDAFNPKKETEYKKLTDNGNIQIEYGAHDLALPQEQMPLTGDTYRIVDIELRDTDAEVEALSSKDSLLSATLLRVSEKEE
jgi:hypothetical protein